MKNPILKGEWIPVENPEEKGITHQNFRAYILAVGATEDLQKFQLLNEALFFEKDYSPDQNSAEFPVRIPWYNPPIPPWNSNGELNLESLTVITTVQAISETFSSDIIESEPLHLSALDVGKPSGLQVSMMPFPEFYEEVNDAALRSGDLGEHVD